MGELKSGIREPVVCAVEEGQPSVNEPENGIDAAEWSFIRMYNRLVDCQLEARESHKILIKKAKDLSELLNASIIRQRFFNNWLLRRQYERFHSHDEWLTSVVTDKPDNP